MPCRACSSRRASRSTACWPPMRTGIICWAGSRSETCRWAVRNPPPSALAQSRERAQRSLRDFDQEHYVADRKPLSLAAVQSLPVPGRLALGSDGVELELHPADGHTADGAAYVIPWLEVLVCGDYLSPAEIPMISAGGSLRGLPGHARPDAAAGRGGANGHPRPRRTAGSRRGARSAGGGPRVPPRSGNRRRRRAARARTTDGGAEADSRAERRADQLRRRRPGLATRPLRS